jgi:hypothetical protein
VKEVIVQGQRILTKEGIKFIEEVTMGDSVLGQNGEWVELVGLSHRKLKTQSDHRCVDIEVEGEIDVIKLTSDHYVYAYVNLVGMQYVPVSELTDMDYLLTPKITSSGQKGENVSLDMAWFLGAYSSKGKLKMTPDGYYVILFYDSETSTDIVKRACQVAGQLGAEEASANFDSEYEVFKVTIKGERIFNVLFDLFHVDGCLVPTQIPSSFHEWSLEKKTEFFSGLVQSTKSNNKWSMKWLAHSINMSFHYAFIAASLGLGFDHQTDLWDYSGTYDSSIPKRSDDKFIFKRIKSIATKPFNFDKIGYNLFIDEDNSCCLGTISIGTL